MKKMIKSFANKAICAAFVILGAMSVCAELVKTPILQTFDDVAEPVSVGYKVTGLENGEVAMVYTNHLKTATWTVPYGLENVEFLVVGGGGGGGASTDDALGGGGGGGGCVVTGILKNVSLNSSILIKVGSGTKGGTYTAGKTDKVGAAGASTVDKNASYFLINGTTNVIAYCGGREMGWRKTASYTSGGYGGSNAGSRNTTPNGDYPDGRPAYINSANMLCYNSLQKGGGVAYADAPAAAGGGGGATQEGSDSYKNGKNGEARNGGNGGEGLSSGITGTRVVYGSGGGGGTTRSCKTYWADSAYTDESLPGKGGEGAGNGGSYGGAKYKDTMNPGKNALANQGGGGGGGGNKANGGNGGSGIVVFRYRVASEKPAVVNPVYNGTEQVGVSGDGFTVVSGTVAATDVGTYTAVLSPEGGAWADGTEGNYEVTWKILPIMTALDVNENDGYIVRGLGDGNEVAVVFTNENANVINWTVPAALNNAQFLVVGGGGGGGADNSVDSNERIAGAGGGGGGVVTGRVNFDKDTVVSVTVGAGGLGGKMSVDASGDSGYGGAYNGEDSIFGVNGIAWVTADGGGSDQGASANNSYLGGKDGSAGGSGAGGRAYANGGAETQGDVNSVNVTSSHKYGFPGGNGCTVANGGYGYGAAGGGGGATAAGYDGTKEDAYKGGDGGAGLASDITGILTVYGSGGGGSSTWGSAGAGGEGAGDGGYASNGENALANQGGGGGGSSRKAATGGNGGSGIVVFRFVYPEVASVDGYGYLDLGEAISAADAGETVTLLANAGNIELGKSIALNLNGCTVDQITLTGTDVTLTAPEDLEVKTSVDGYEVAYDDGVYSLQKVAVVQIGETTYATLAEAVAAVQNGETVKLLADVAATETITVAGKSITLDLNGKTISGVCNTSQSCLVYVENNAALTVKDSAGNGKLTFAQGTSNVGWTVDVKGAFVLESGTVELTGSWSIGYAVDVRPNAWGTAYVNPTVFTMNGGNIVSSDGGVRVASSSDSADKNVSASFVMKGGKINAAWDGVFIQQSDAIYDNLAFEITGGTIESDLNPVRVYGPAPTDYVSGQDCMNIALKGGTLEYTGTESYEWVVDEILRVGGGSSAETIVENGSLSVSGEIAADSAAPEGFKWESASDGMAVLVAKPTAADLPDAEVTNLGSITVGLGDYKADAYMMYDIINGGKLQEAVVPYDLTLAMDFKAKDTAETAAQNAFGNYTTDFFITMSGMSQASFVGDGCYLAGYYPSFKAWVKIPLDGFTVENGKVYPVITSAGFDFKYTDICGTVGQFICGIYLTPEVLAANPNLTVDLTLGLAENKDAALNAQFFKVDNYVYDVDDLVALPEVVITDIKNTLTDADPDLTFALNFAIKDVDKLSEEYLEKLFAKYGDYYTDYVLTISGLTDPNGSVKFNANGNGDGYLAGQYDAWSTNWVTVPFSDVTVTNGQSFYIMEYAAELMNKGGLRLTLKEIAEIVKNFDCGVYFTPEFLAVNPNLKVELELKVFTEDENGNKVGDISVATNTFDKDDFSVEAAKLDIRIVNGKPQIGFAGEGKLVLNAAAALTGEWTKNISYTVVENDGDDAKTWVTPAEGYYFFKGFITK